MPCLRGRNVSGPCRACAAGFVPCVLCLSCASICTGVRNCRCVLRLHVGDYREVHVWSCLCVLVCAVVCICGGVNVRELFTRVVVYFGGLDFMCGS